jgi:hypothetical protein
VSCCKADLPPRRQDAKKPKGITTEITDGTEKNDWAISVFSVAKQDFLGALGG